MGLLQKALETYESHYRYVGENREGCSMMAPVGHVVTRADLEITLDRNGAFVDAAAVVKDAPKIIIPATESSAGRTSSPTPHPHPLCEQLKYLIPANKTLYDAYVEQLEMWASSDCSHPKLLPILHYIQGGSIISDLLHCGLIKLNENGMPKDEKAFIRWRVQGDGVEECWLDHTLFDAFTSYYFSIYTGDAGLCMITGQETTIAGQHPKGIVSSKGNAKLISANDSSGFTYRGRIAEEWQAATIGYEASQKAHNALRWLVQEQGVSLGGRTFLCWNPQGRIVVPPHLPFMQPPKPTFLPSEYKNELKKALNSKKTELEITDGVVIAAFDAATDGRLSLIYYSELQAHDFLERLHDWDANCCWIHRKFGVSTPSLESITDCAFGFVRNKKIVTDEKIFCQYMQRLIACRVERARIGADIVKALVDRASRPQAFKGEVDEAWGRKVDDFWEEILFAACAVVRKYRTDRFKEEWSMALEPERKDRSYQFGRLLAVMEKVERDTYETSDEREPNALRLMSVFCQRPMQTAYNLEKQLERAYFPRLLRKYPGQYSRYKKLLGEILDIISLFPGEENKPLEDSYLMGYYLQRSALYTKQADDEMEETENE